MAETAGWPVRPFVVVGTGRSGTLSVARLLGACRSTQVEHERFPLRWDDGAPARLRPHLEYFDTLVARGIRPGLVDRSLLPHVPALRAARPDLAVVCLHREREATVRSWMRWTDGVSRVLPSHRNDPDWRQRRYAPLFPLLEAESAEDSYRAYWDLCERLMAELDGAHHVDVDDLRSDAALARLHEHLGIPPADRAFPAERHFNAAPALAS